VGSDTCPPACRELPSRLQPTAVSRATEADRPGRDLLRLAGMARCRDLRWPLDATVLDGEACAGDGHEGIQAVFEERNRDGGDMSFLAFDLLTLDGQDVMRDPWKDRRKRLEFNGTPKISFAQAQMRANVPQRGHG